MNDQSHVLTQLLHAIADEDKDAFNRLHQLYFIRLRRFAYSFLKQEELAEEITSDLFIRIWLKKETLTRIEHPQIYLYKAIKNQCLNALKKNSNRKNEPITERDHDRAAISDTPIQQLENKELMLYLDAIISTLPEQRRLIFRLVKDEGMKHKDVASLLDISVRTVENQLYKAIKYLAEKVEIYLQKSPYPELKNNRQQLLSLLF